MHHSLGKYLAGIGLGLVLLAACQAGTTPASTPTSKIAPQVMLAAQAALQGAPISARVDAQGRLQVYVYVSDLSSGTLDRLGRAGLTETRSNPEMNVVQGWIAPRDLDALAALDCVKNITLPRYASPR